MKRLIPILLTIVVALASACKKKEEARYSKWYINKDTFVTNNVKVFIHKVNCEISDYNRPNYFGFLFAYPPSISEEPFILIGGEQLTGFQSCCAGFIAQDTISYIPSPSCRVPLVIVKIDGKATWTMPPTWCINKSKPADSVLIGGEFSEP